MDSVLTLERRWRRYQAGLVEVTATGEVEYLKFLERFEVRLREQYAEWQRTVLQMFYNSLLAADLQLTELLQFFDRDGDGMVSLSECTAALSSLELGLSAQQIKQLAATLGFQSTSAKGNAQGIRPTNGDEPLVALETYLRRLAVVADHSVIARSEQELLDLKLVATWISETASTSGQSLSSIFQLWDENGDGYIDYEEFVSCCVSCQEQVYLSHPSSLEYMYAREEFEELARTVDQAKTGRINFLSFLGLFSEPHAENEGKVVGVAQAFAEQMRTIWYNDAALTSALRKYDIKVCGAVAPHEFAQALESMSSALDHSFAPLTADSIEAIVTLMPLDAQGNIDYLEFMAAFEVQDKQQVA